MSVINRMLTDLERRGAPGARRRQPAHGPSGVVHSRRLARPLRRAGPLALLIALVAVAGGLWHQQWSDVLALAGSYSGKPAATDAAATDDAARGTAAPAVDRFEFERDGRTTRLVVGFDGPLPEAPGYGRRGDRIGLQLPARWDRATMPAPPDGQSVYRGTALTEAAGKRTRIGIEIDPEARFDLAIEGNRLILTGRAPAAADGADPEDTGRAEGDDGDRASAAAEPVGEPESATATPADDATDRPEPDDTTADAAGTRDSAGAPDDDRADAANGTDASQSDRATAETGGTDGAVRKSAPEVRPEERARRLESAAREALDGGDVTRARDRLARALTFDGDRHSARDLLVGLSLRRGDAAAARKLLAEGVARAPERGAYAKPYARLLVDAGDLDRALRALRRAAPARERDAGYHGLTAAVAQRLERHELAASEYTRALEIDSGHGVWWMGLGISLRATDHPGEALAAFREARATGDLNERLDRWVRQRIDALSRARE